MINLAYSLKFQLKNGSDRKTACAANREALFNVFEICGFPKCITYISQVYSPSVNVRKPWKYFHFALRSV